MTGTMRGHISVIVVGVLASACGTVRPVPYTPNPRSITDPLDALRDAMQPSCRYPLALALGRGEVRITDPCSTDFFGRPKIRRIDIAAMTDVRIRFGDWPFVEVMHGTTVVTNLAFDTVELATRAADALWVLRERYDSPSSPPTSGR